MEKQDWRDGKPLIIKAFLLNILLPIGTFIAIAIIYYFVQLQSDGPAILKIFSIVGAMVFLSLVLGLWRFIKIVIITLKLGEVGKVILVASIILIMIIANIVFDKVDITKILP